MLLQPNMLRQLLVHLEALSGARENVPARRSSTIHRQCDCIARLFVLSAAPLNRGELPDGGPAPTLVAAWARRSSSSASSVAVAPSSRAVIADTCSTQVR